VGRFMRTIELPARTNPDKAEARYANGVLTVRIPKDEAARPRRIAVKAS
jgi:HSP20 family protein